MSERLTVTDRPRQPEWDRVPGFGHEGGLSFERRGNQEMLIVNTRIPLLPSAQPVSSAGYPPSYHSPIATSPTDDGSLLLHYQVGMRPTDHPTTNADYGTLESFVNIVWDSLTLLRHFSRGGPLPSLGLGYSVLCMPGYEEPRLMVLLGAKPSDAQADIRKARALSRIRDDQWPEETVNVATKLHHLLAHLFGNIGCPRARAKAPALHGQTRTLREDVCEITTAARVAAVVADYLRYGQVWNSEFIEQLSRAFALGPASRYYSLELNTLLPPELWDTVDLLHSGLLDHSSPESSRVDELLNSAKAGLSQRLSLMQLLPETLLKPAATDLPDSAPWRMSLLSRSHW